LLLAKTAASLKTSSTKTKPAGYAHTAEALASPSPLVLQAPSKTEPFATLFAKTAITASALSAGKAAPVASRTPVLIVSSLLLMVEVLVILVSLHAKASILKVVRRTVFFIILSAMLTSIMLGAVFALPTVLLGGLISVSHAKREAMAEALALLLFVLLIKMKMLGFVIRSVIVDIMELGLFAGDHVLMV